MTNRRKLSFVQDLTFSLTLLCTSSLKTIFLFSVFFLPLSITWFKPDRGEAINIAGQVSEVSTVCVTNTDTCAFKHYVSTLMGYFDMINQLFTQFNIRGATIHKVHGSVRYFSVKVIFSIQKREMSMTRLPSGSYLIQKPK